MSKIKSMNCCCGLNPLKTILCELQNIQRGLILSMTCVSNAIREKTGRVVGLSTKQGQALGCPGLDSSAGTLMCSLPPSLH